ncbi:hypothetical protein [Desulfobotulus alkaliphilus]|uniref:hypothetical protein n=1 Tax=Desulfobotulus alkaliphilus TaxID=622671 RepID=UPI00119D1CF3|nr:hypothetical protein [Desulfobotulus alkaliphilus]
MTSFLSTLLILLACLGLYPFFPHAFTAEDPAGERLTGSQKFQAFAVLFFICAVCFTWVHYMAALLAEAFTENPQDRFTPQAISAMATAYWPVLLTGLFLRLEDFFLICLRFMEEKDVPDPEDPYAVFRFFQKSAKPELLPLRSRRPQEIPHPTKGESPWKNNRQRCLTNGAC